MTWADLTDNDKKVYEFVRDGDFETKKWSTPDATKKLGLPEKDIYESMSNLTKNLKDKFWIYYKDGGLRVVADPLN